MNEQKKLVPKLRFPEFRFTKGWVPSILANACDMQAGKFVSASKISECTQTGLFPCYGGNGLRGYTATFTHDGTYPLVGRQGALCGNVRLVSGRFHATEHAVVATPRNGIFVGWLNYSLDLLNLNRFATGQAQPGLSVDVLENISLAIPPLESEQQRIADCLGSLDELIAAQGRKVEALKTHKKGLMQQLFPREGENQPRLRFPEFRESEDWDRKQLGDFSDVSASGDLDSSLFSSNKTMQHVYPVYSNAVERDGIYGYYSEARYPRDSVTITARGTLGVAFLRRQEFMGIGRLLVVKDIHGVAPKFLVECWNHLAVIPKEVTSIPQLTAVTARGLSLPIPANMEEQQRIADFLASVDTLITAATQALDSLKTHKQGLMQQLFPSAEAVAA